MANPFENNAIVGRDVAVFICLTASATVPDDADFEPLGAVRGLEYGAEWETADTTARGTSSGFARSSLVTFKNNNIAIDGLVIVNDAVQVSLEDHIDTPPVLNNNQPTGWIRVIEPRAAGATRVISTPALFTSFRKTNPHDAESTWNMSADSQGEPVKVNVAAS